MSKTLGICFGVLIFASAALWIAGLMTSAVVPMFGGVRAVRLGEIGFATGLIGEACTYLFGWLRGRALRDSPDRVKNLIGSKRYGHKKGSV